MAKYIKKLVYLDKPCKQCGKLMRGTANQLAERVFCSQQCNADEKKAHNLRVCKECGVNFHARIGGNSTKGSGNFCTQSCYGKWISRERVLHDAHVDAMRKNIARQAARLISKQRKTHQRRRYRSIACVCYG